MVLYCRIAYCISMHVAVRSTVIQPTREHESSAREGMIAVRYCTALYCIILYYAVLYCTISYCTMAFNCQKNTASYRVSYVILPCTILYCTLLHYTAPYCTILYHTVLCCTVLYCTILYHTVLCCTVLYYTMRYHTMPYGASPPADPCGQGLGSARLLTPRAGAPGPRGTPS